MNITLVSTTAHKSGGKAYEDMVANVLSRHMSVEKINTGMDPAARYKYLRIPIVLWRNFLISKKRNVDIIIKDVDASLFANPRPVKDVAIVHHIDLSFFPFIPRIIYTLLQRLTFRKIKKFAALVTVSRYWYDYFIAKGYTNVHLIYNAFSLNDYEVSAQEIGVFKKKYHLEEKPIIYLGNCHKVKGVQEVYEALKHLDVHLVTSGKRHIIIPAKNLELSEREYIILMKASSVVVSMSTLKEGWSRTTHQAMLCRTPVIGSGAGGMRELLEGGEQIICDDVSQIASLVTSLLASPLQARQLGKKGYEFAKTFTQERFEREWVSLVNRL